MKQTFTAVFAKESDGYTVTVPALPGLVTAGRTLKEAKTMAREAIECHLESLRKDGEPVPPEIKVDVERLEVELAAS